MYGKWEADHRYGSIKGKEYKLHTWRRSKRIFFNNHLNRLTPKLKKRPHNHRLNQLKVLAWISLTTTCRSWESSPTLIPWHCPGSQREILSPHRPSRGDEVLGVEWDLKQRNHESELFLARLNKKWSLFPWPKITRIHGSSVLISFHP